MEIIVSTNAISEQFRFFGSLFGKSNSTSPEITYVLIEASEEHGVTVKGTDYNGALKVRFPADSFQIIKAGALCIRADKLLEVINTLDSSIPSVRLCDEDNGWGNILFRKSRLRISGIKASLYPDILTEPKPETEKIKMSSKSLLRIINNVSHATSNQDTRYLISSVHLAFLEESVIAEATDGFKAAQASARLATTEKAFDLLLHKEAVTALKRILSSEDPTNEVELAVEQNHVFFAFGGDKNLSFRKLSGQFPSFDKVFARSDDFTEALIDYDCLQSSLKRANIFSDKSNLSCVVFTFRNDELELSSRSFEVGNAVDTIECKYQGPEVQVKFSCNAILEFLSGVTTSDSLSQDDKPTIKVMFNSDNKKHTIWSVYRPMTDELIYDYNCVITKIN